MKVYKLFTTKMTVNKMADTMYAIIMTKAKLTSSFCLCYDWGRRANCQHNADIMIEIEDTEIEKFQRLANVILKAPMQVKLNQQ